MAKRSLLLHYHLFKNAGSSVDRLLRESFGSAWVNFDKDLPGQKISPAEMQEFIEAHPDIRAVSSHQIMPPVPVGDFDITPLVFLRDPIDRVKSAYLFEWQKQLNLAEPKGSLQEYIREKLLPGKGTVIANFQVSRLSNQRYDEIRPMPGVHDLDRLAAAQQFIRKLPFFGLVERFDESIALLASVTSEKFPEIECKIYRENSSRAEDVSINGRYNQFRKEIGEELFHEVVYRNHLDLQLYSYALGLFDIRCEQLEKQSASVRQIIAKSA
ncbi:MAG: sulfotransferase family 2 domain-containing protein [Granulosicoccus sp.]|nr:sulfotransferase family 2 domain-containing protein [Granulosicoccus sp.]